MSIPAIKIQNLAFQYPRQEGVCFKNFHLEIAAGERFGLFGPNGAGKTTLMNLMTGLLKYSAGSIRLLDHEIIDHPEIHQYDFRIRATGFFILPGINRT